jgi:hypothetical protein
MKYIKKFANSAEYQAFTEGGGYITPNLCLLTDTKDVVLEPKKKILTFPIRLYEGQNDIEYTNQIFEWLDTLQLGDDYYDKNFYSIYRRSKNVTDFEEYEKIYDDYRNVIILNDTLYSIGLSYHKEYGKLYLSLAHLYTIDGDLLYKDTLPSNVSIGEIYLYKNGILTIRKTEFPTNPDIPLPPPPPPPSLPTTE